MSPIDMGVPMKIPPDGGLSMGAPPPPPPGPPPPSGDTVQITKGPDGFVVIDAGGAPEPVGDLPGLMDFLQSRFGEAPPAEAPPPAGPPMPPGPV